jgi:hypothetical protein
MKKRILFTFALAGAITTAGLGLKYVRAHGIPDMNPMYYSGTLTENGQIVSGQRDFTVNLWADGTTPGTPLCQTLSSATPVENGRFRIALASACVAAINQNNNAWIEVLDGTTSLGRTKIGAVPYAVEANHATSADTATTAPNATHASSADTATTATNATNATNATVAAHLAKGAIRVLTLQNGGCVHGSQSTDCTCGADEIAISGGGFAGGGPTGNTYWLNESNNGLNMASTANIWRITCVNNEANPAARIDCVAPFALCMAVQ